MNKVVQTKYGNMYYNTNDIGVGKTIQLYGEYYNSELQLLSNFLKKGDNIIDVGANIGTHTLFFSTFKGHVYSFEPQIKNFELLATNVIINNINNVSLFLKAVSNTNDYLNFDYIDFNNNINAGGYGVNIYGDYKIESITLDSLNLKSIKCIKIDVEGHEKYVIEGARELISQQKPILYVENNIYQCSEELISLIKSLHYKIFEHKASAFNINNFNDIKFDITNQYKETNLLCIHEDKIIEDLYFLHQI